MRCFVARRRFVLLVGLLLVCAGCGKKPVSIEGTVTFDGKPVESGSISFEPVDGRGPSLGGPIQAGRYSVVGDSSVAPGKKIVRIVADRKTGRKVESGPPNPPGTMVDEIESYIPAKFNTKSTLNCEVTASGPNRHNFDLTSR